MGYTHGFTLEDEFRVCTGCGKKLPNTPEVFGWAKKGKILQAKCKECRSIESKEKNKKLRESKPMINRPVYDGTKECICCHRQLPNNWMYFPTDKTTVSGLRNKCRECSPNYRKFLSEDSKISIKWTDEDIQLLKEVYPHYTGIELQEKFFPNRTVRAIECQGQLLGIDKTEEEKERAHKIQGEKIKPYMSGRIFSEDTKKKISEARKEYFKTHESNWKGRVVSEEERQRIRERVKGRWTGDKNPRHINPLSREQNGRWKGGINKTYFELRSDTKDWQKESMEFCKYKCVITGGGFDEIHHVIPFRDIVDEAFVITGLSVLDKVQDYSKEDFELLRNTTKELHIKYGFGACVNGKVHKLFHDNYGYTNFNNIDFLNFINEIENHKYDQWFFENNLEININKEYIEYLIKQFNTLAA